MLDDVTAGEGGSVVALWPPSSGGCVLCTVTGFPLRCTSWPSDKPHARTTGEERAVMHLCPDPLLWLGVGHLARPHQLPVFLLQINVLRNRVSDHQKV